jgi:DNA modification methylase
MSHPLIDIAMHDLARLSDSGLSDAQLKTLVPTLAKRRGSEASISRAIAGVATEHKLVLGDARQLRGVDDESVHLVVTSPPYWTLKKYVGSKGQLGDVADYDDFLNDLRCVWNECKRVLVPGGRLIVNVGDVCLSRREHGRHAVVPLHASITEQCRSLGFDNLAPIIWYKISNAKFEADSGGGGFLGKPYEPNAVIKNDIEFILMQRKPGGYRRPSSKARVLSFISEENHKEWFQQIWRLPGASTRSHPAPYPVELAERLIRMFSFVGDTVLDPFAGTGTTSIAASHWGRHSIGFEIEPTYVAQAARRLRMEFETIGNRAELLVK